MQTSLQALTQTQINPYTLKHNVLDAMGAEVRSTVSSVDDLEQMRLNASEIHTSLQGIEKFLCTCEWGGFN